MKHKRFDFGVCVLYSKGVWTLSFCVEVAGEKTVLTEFAGNSKEINPVSNRFWKENVDMSLC